MTLDEIKQAINEGKPVYCGNTSYQVIKDSIGQYLIAYMPDNYIGLTHKDGKTLNGQESDFFTT